MDFDLPEDLIALRDVVRKFAAERIRPHARAWDADQHMPDEIIREMAEMGLLGVFTPARYGGSELGYLANAVVM